MLQVLIKCSKTDPYRLGLTLYIGATNTKLCPLAAVIEYLLARGSKEGPLYLAGWLLSDTAVFCTGSEGSSINDRQGGKKLCQP